MRKGIHFLAAAAAAESSPQRKLWVNGNPRTRKPRQGRKNGSAWDENADVLVGVDIVTRNISIAPHFFRRYRGSSCVFRSTNPQLALWAGVRVAATAAARPNSLCPICLHNL